MPDRGRLFHHREAEAAPASGASIQAFINGSDEVRSRTTL
jgi:hypothetical protein